MRFGSVGLAAAEAVSSPEISEIVKEPETLRNGSSLNSTVPIGSESRTTSEAGSLVLASALGPHRVGHLLVNLGGLQLTPTPKGAWILALRGRVRGPVCVGPKPVTFNLARGRHWQFGKSVRRQRRGARTLEGTGSRAPVKRPRPATGWRARLARARARRLCAGRQVPA